MEIVRNRPKKLLDMCQEAYIKKVLECFHMHYSKPVNTLIEMGLTLILDQCPNTDDEKEQMRHITFDGVIGSLMYAIHMAWQLFYG